MATISNYFDQAQLSQAAYALGLQQGWSGGGTEQDPSPYALQLIDGGMSKVQAIEFASTYTVVNQFTESGGIFGQGEGFSGTVFKDKAGKYYMALRGTEGGLFSAAGLIDWTQADIADIGGDGIAIHQAVEMYNWYQRLITPVGQTAAQYIYHEEVVGVDIQTGNGLVLQTPASLEKTEVIVTGASGAYEGGYLAGMQDKMIAIGHSLGGHLAMIMSRVDPNRISTVSTYNAPAFDPPVGTPFPLTTQGFFDLLRQAEVDSSGQSSVGTGWNASIIDSFRIPVGVVGRTKPSDFSARL
ncbi:MAG TPA: hypothetical protein VKA23_02265 [Mariprofundaceae bacterium]|nr:hypothetical protein [Mariprofundaceae bacterium]